MCDGGDGDGGAGPDAADQGHGSSASDAQGGNVSGAPGAGTGPGDSSVAGATGQDDGQAASDAVGAEPDADAAAAAAQANAAAAIGLVDATETQPQTDTTQSVTDALISLAVPQTPEEAARSLVFSLHPALGIVGIIGGIANALGADTSADDGSSDPGSGGAGAGGEGTDPLPGQAGAPLVDAPIVPVQPPAASQVTPVDIPSLPIIDEPTGPTTGAPDPDADQQDTVGQQQAAAQQGAAALQAILDSDPREGFESSIRVRQSAIPRGSLFASSLLPRPSRIGT